MVDKVIFVEVRNPIIIIIIIVAIMVMNQVKILSNKKIILEVKLNGLIIGPSSFNYVIILGTQNNNAHNYLITICKLILI